MSSSQNFKKVTSFIDFVPAELRENNRWEIIYYVKNPFTDKLKRKAIRVRPLKSITLRRKLGKRMVLEINRKLERGWNPLIDSNEAKGFIKFSEASDIFLKRTEQEVHNSDKRKDTLRSYKSFINNLCNYLIEIGEKDMFVVKFNEEIVNDFLDVIYYDRDNSARTRNNYLNFIKTFSDWLIRHKYISKNPTVRIELIPEKTKQRDIIPDGTLKEIFNYLKKEKPRFYILCLIGYYCFIRRTEITKIRVSDIIIKNGVIYVSKSASKNKKSMPVTIPDIILPQIADHIKSSVNGDFLFSNSFLTGSNQLAPKKISDEWSKVRKALKLPNRYQWYSLKDTGITNMLKAGVPTIAVRDQARHHSITQTEAYTPKEILVANSDIRTISL